MYIIIEINNNSSLLYEPPQATYKIGSYVRDRHAQIN